ncbi:HNH endonuclease [Arthrobacter crusticola]|uniref:HNH endonuclease n=1 Tax=Arthrobacter crusticola TaxID=2547960 RepID=A0A4R5U2A4_9MICC|nr:HNH endonuclease signature motif containing protein [Arthrobacter crusticola]TDK27722.1 HNH endonuclease [Arthrobacter crusticola]
MDRAGTPDAGVDPTQRQGALWLEAAAGILGAGFLAGGPAETASLEEALGGLEAMARLKNWADAQTVRFTERVRVLTAERLEQRGMHPGSLADTLTASEVACALRIPERTAGTLVQHAYLLTGHLPATLTALDTGTISWRHAATIVEECAGIPDFALPYFEQKLIPLAQDTTAARLAHRARRLRTEMHPEPLSKRTESAQKNRRVDYRPDDDGMAWLNVYLPAEQAVAIDGRLTRLSRALQCPGEARTLTQLRTDVLTDLLTHTCPAHTAPGGPGIAPAGAGAAGATPGGAGAAGAGRGPGRPVEPHGWNGIQAQVHVTVPVLTLLDVDDAPGELEGYGPIAPDLARRLAAHAPSFTRLLTHPETGAVLSVGRDTYTVPADLKKWLRVRDRTCRHPGCNRSAAAAELDHTLPWSRAGTTAHNNLAHLCRRHHMLKSQGLWHYEQPQPGNITATSPAGRTYQTLPEPAPG